VWRIELDFAGCGFVIAALNEFLLRNKAVKRRCARVRDGFGDDFCTLLDVDHARYFLTLYYFVDTKRYANCLG